MSTLITRIDEGLYPDFARNWDDLMFRQRILAYLRPQSVVLDLGTGAGIIAQMDFHGRAAQIHGVDLDLRVVDNPMLTESRIGNANEIPYESDRFDVVFSDNVLEHLDEPEAVFREVARVLKPGGVFLADSNTNRDGTPQRSRKGSPRQRASIPFQHIERRLLRSPWPLLPRLAGDAKMITAVIVRALQKLDLQSFRLHPARRCFHGGDLAA